MQIKLKTKSEQNIIKNLLWNQMEATKSNRKYELYERLYDEIVDHLLSQNQ